MVGNVKQNCHLSFIDWCQRHNNLEFPHTNKFHQDVEEKFGTNAKVVEDLLKRVDWKFVVHWYSRAFLILVASVFIFIVAVRAAFALF